MKILSGHTTPETAFVVQDYPFGFRLRCKIRYWLEYKPGKGYRFWSQTTNPKRPTEVWNKPKASTFQRFGGVMFQDEKQHVHWIGLTEYDTVKECSDFMQAYGDTLPEHGREYLRQWISKKLAFEQAKSEGVVVSKMTTTEYGCITAPDFGKPISEPKVEVHVLKSNYTPEQLLAMGQANRAPISEGLAQLKAPEMEAA